MATANSNGNKATEIERAQRRTIQAALPYENQPYAQIFLPAASIADTIPPWGFRPQQRDALLRSFWPRESILASCVYSTAMRNASYSWTLDGPPRTTAIYQRVLQGATFGQGWNYFVMRLMVDVFTQDNGGFVEIIRQSDSEGSPVVGIANLDASKCRRTGVDDWPVIYTDKLGREHKLRPWQVAAFVDFPMPNESMNGMGMCAVSRALTAAQLARDALTYQREKLSGNNPNLLHIVNGVSKKAIEDALIDDAENAMGQRYTVYRKPTVLASLDPTAKIDHVEIPLAALPDNYDEETTKRWYINQLALAFGADYQDFAPLPGRGLGTSGQSEVLAMKSRGKGPAQFMAMFTHFLNFSGVLPANVEFAFDEKDLLEEQSDADIRLKRVTVYKTWNDVGVPLAGLLQMALDNGDIEQELFDQLSSAPDVTPNITVDDNSPAETQQGEPQAQNPAYQQPAALPANDQSPQGQPPAPQPQSRPMRPPVSVAALRDKAAITAANDALSQVWPKQERGLQRAIETALTETLADAAEMLGVSSDTKELDAGQISGEKAIDPPQLLESPAFWQNFRLRMTRAMLSESRNGMLTAVDVTAQAGLGVDFDRVNSDVLALSRSYTNSWWEKIEPATRRAMREAIISWQEFGLGKQGLPDLVDSLRPLFGPQRASRIAATEITAIFDAGNHLAHIASGITQEEWLTVEDALVDDVCLELNGQIFGINEGPRPPLHINCRCRRVPVAPTLAQPVG